jgi:hypothetical protein
VTQVYLASTVQTLERAGLEWLGLLSVVFACWMGIRLVCR